MAITIGLDFGTHQTKICIENSDDPLHKTYEFYDWGDGVFALPSVIQINKDRTISYGNVDINNALVGRKKKNFDCPEKLVLPVEPEKPVLKEIEALVLPPMPVYECVTEYGVKFKIPYRDLYGIGKPIPYKSKPKNSLKEWKRKCKKILQEYQQELIEWKRFGIALGSPKPMPPTLPPKPRISKNSSGKNKLEEINPNMIATKKQIAEFEKWKLECEQLWLAHKKVLALNNDRLNGFNRRHKLWVEECNRLKHLHEIRTKLYLDSLVEYPMIFRYFKQAVFSEYKWNYQFNPEDLVVLYLAYIIFKLEKRFGDNFAIQMGIPASENTFKRLKSYASGLLIQAIRLVEDVFENDFDKFLKTPYNELFELIPQFEYSEDLKFQYGIMVLPEAYASLRSVTANGRIPRGMSVILDIGGGTTDLSFFVIEDNGEPHVYHFESISKGLNYFLEYGNNVASDFSLKRELEDLSPNAFTKAYGKYKTLVDKYVGNLTNFLHTDTISRGFNKHAFTDAIHNRPVIYTGGGCYDKRMRRSVLNFTDVIYIDKNILRIPNMIDENLVTVPYSIVATSFGLSMAITSDDIQVSKKEELFAKYTKEGDSYWDAHHEHGMYED